MADSPRFSIDKKAEFLAFLVWVALIGAVLILVIDYSIKQAILQSAKEAKESLDALKGQAGRPGYSVGIAGDKPGSVRSNADTQMEVGTVPVEASANGRSREANGRFAKPETGNDDQGISGADKPVQP